MRTLRRLTFLALVAGLAASVGTVTAADNPRKLKKALEAARAAELAKKKAAETSQKPDPTPARKAPPADDATPPLKPAKLDNPTAFVDARVAAGLAAEKLTPSPAAADAEFVRRVYLDLTGTIPTAAQARAFLDDPAADKRSKLIDTLLASPAYGQHQADIWFGLLVERSSDNRRVDFSSFRGWLTDEFNNNRPWNELVTAVVTSTGTQDANPAVGFFLSNTTVDKMTDEVSKTFLGLQLQCAQCHNHPFTGWKQTEYWETAAFFLKTQVGGLGKDAKPGVSETERPRRGKGNQLPESAKLVPPKFPQGDAPTLAASDPHRPALAAWMTGPTNPFFARAMVNRVWYGLFAVGLVNPVDDMHGANLPSHPELLDGLAADFAASGFDVKRLHRAICNSQAYQRSSRPTAGNETAEPTSYARGPLKVLSPEQLFDSLDTAVKLSRGDAARGRDKTTKGVQSAVRDRFAQFFLAGAEQPNPKDYEAGIPQALRLMNARQVVNPTGVREIVGSLRGPAAVEALYLSTLSRRPTAAELALADKHLATASTPADGYTDLLWALVNCSEFALNR